MNISEAAAAAGVSPKMVRHYESIGLIPKAERTEAGYRAYRPADIQQLRFIRRARAVGFSIAEIRQLLSLWQDRNRPARDVHQLASAHLDDLQRRIREMQEIAATLGHLLEHCHGDDRPECPILDSLADPAQELPLAPRV